MNILLLKYNKKTLYLQKYFIHDRNIRAKNKGT